MIAWVWLLGCPRQAVPNHLAVLPPSSDQVATVGPITTRDDALAFWIGSDPLARSPRLPSTEQLQGIAGTADLERVARTIERLEQHGGAVELELGRIAYDLHSPATPLVRGYLWRRAENTLSRPDLGPGLEVTVTPLRHAESDAQLELQPLRFLKDETASRAYGERWVLDAWLHSPTHPHGLVAARLAAPQYAHLAGSSSGRILRGRVGGEADVSAAFVALERATLASLTRASADRDQEQAEWADLLLDLRDELNTTDPVTTLLSTAFDGLVAGAANDEAAGAAIVALGARRWLGTCPDAPCDGLDRTEAFASARRYGGRADQLARVWQVIALKDALDTMEVGQDSILFPEAARQLVDALHGTGAGPFDASILMRASPAPATWLSLSRATGGDDVAVDWATARNQLAAHVVTVVDDAMIATPDGPLKPLLERVRSRAAR